MSDKSGSNDALWLVSGTATLVAVILAVLLFNARTRPNPAEQLASKLQRIEQVGRLQVALAAAVEAEKSSVLAITDADSQLFADQTRAATANIARTRDTLHALLAAAGNQDERDLLLQFNEAFAEFQRIDRDLLALAVKNTNLKAAGLVFGPAAAALSEMDAALAHLPDDDVTSLHLADTARIAAWRLLTLLPPHIAEENDAKMDAMEVMMTAEDQKVRRSLATLATMKELANHAELNAATASYAQFSALKAEILKLSRENTNVRSLAISLNEKRRITHVCQAELTALHQAIEAEPVASATYGHINAREQLVGLSA